MVNDTHNFEVTADALELRAGPGTEHAIVERLAHGSVVTAVDTAGWTPVVTQPDGRSGWVATRYLAPVMADAAPVQAAPPEPASAPQSGLTPVPAPIAVCSSDAPGLVFDLSHYNGKVDLAAAYAAGQRGVIHKATEGRGYVDPMYAATRSQAAAAGLLWGAYHFGVAGDPEAQAQHFLATAKPDHETLLVLDLESNPEGGSMSLPEARSFVSAVHEATGTWPGLYGGSYLREQLGDKRDALLGKCWFWLAEYGPKAHVPPGWQDWTLWQYTDGHVDSPHSISGVGACDRNRFNGDEQQLLAFWKRCGAAAV